MHNQQHTTKKIVYVMTVIMKIFLLHDNKAQTKTFVLISYGHI